jgi:hypothetical protein
LQDGKPQMIKATEKRRADIATKSSISINRKTQRRSCLPDRSFYPLAGYCPRKGWQRVER